jgi:hypothetical protein
MSENTMMQDFINVFEKRPEKSLNTAMKEMVFEELENKNQEEAHVIVERILTVLKTNYPNTDNFSGFLFRGEFVKTFSWAIPNIECIYEIILFACKEKILSVASGNCFIERFIEFLGGIITSSDSMISHCEFNAFHKNFQKLDAVEAIRQNPTNVLFMCWPSYQGKYAYDALNEFKGNKFIYIGEDEDGCCGSPLFFDLLKNEWELKKQVEIECWYTIHDRMEFYERKIKP